MLVEHSLYRELICEAVFGMDIKKLKEARGVSPQHLLLDHLTLEEDNLMHDVENLIHSLISYGWGYDAIRDFVLKQTAILLEKLNDK